MKLKTMVMLGLATLMGACILPPETEPRTEVRVVYVYESSAQSRYDYDYNARWQYVNPLYRPHRFSFESALNRAIQERHRRPEPRQEHRRPDPPRPSETHKKH
jgi:hypothetical protein